MNQEQEARTVRGMRDILPKEQSRWQMARKEAEEVARIFGFERIDVPVIEYLDVFDRGIGSETDIVSKELFIVNQKDGKQQRAMAMRPEITAGIARSHIQNGMSSWPQPIRLYGIGPVFRYDRPQKGRYREHTQFDVETLGSSSPAADAWVIYLGWRFYEKLGLKGVQVQINSLGSKSCQKEYAKKLVRYFSPHKKSLSEVDQKRLESNPLRLLDSKDAAVQKMAEDAPQSTECLNKEDKKFFSDVLSYLDEYGVKYNLNPRIVRGLDYYTHTVFEFTVEGSGGQQGSIGAGGRYDQLISTLGGGTVPGVGMGIGMDRIVLEMTNQKVKVTSPSTDTDAYIIHLSKRGRNKAQEILALLHDMGFVTLHSADKSSLRAQLKQADKHRAKYAVIIGETEAKNDMCILRDMKSGIQEDVHIQDLHQLLIDRLRNGRSARKSVNV